MWNVFGAFLYHWPALRKVQEGVRESKRSGYELKDFADYLAHYTETLKPPRRLTPLEASFQARLVCLAETCSMPGHRS